MKLLKYAIPAIIIGILLAGGVHALSVALPSSVKKGDLLVGSSTGSSLFTLSTGTAGSVLYVSPSTGVPAWTATSTLGISGGASLSGGSTNSLPIWTSATGIGNSSISQSGGTTLINGVTPIINGGGIWISDIAQSSGANFITQAPTSTLVAGNLTQGGGVQFYQTSTYLTPTQFCSGGLFNISSSSNVNIYFPTLTQLAPGQSPSNCTNNIWGGQFAQQFGVNSGTGSYTINASGTGETLMYAPGSGATIYAGQSQFAQGQFTATSTINGATSTGMSFNAYLQSFQPRATNPTMQGQFLMASSTASGGNPEWVVGNILAGSNITVTTSTAGQITITATGGSASAGGNSGQIQYNNATALGGAEMFFANSRFGINSTTPTAALVVQGTSTQPTVPVLTVSSSSNASLFTVLANGNVGIGTTTPLSPLSVVGAGFGTLRVETSDVAGTSVELKNNDTGGKNWYFISNGTGNNGGAGSFQFYNSDNNRSVLLVQPLGNVGIGSTSPNSQLTVRGYSGTATPLLTVASSSNASYFNIASNGGVSIPTISGSTQCLHVDTNGLISGTGTDCGGGGSLSGGTNGQLPYWTSATSLSSTSAMLYNGTVFGMNATSSTIGFNIQGTAGTNTIFNVASSSGVSLFSITPTGLASATTLSLAGIPVKATFDKSFQLASTTLDTTSLQFSNATTTWNLWNPSYAVTLTKLYCKTDTGTLLLNFGGNLLSCSSTGASSTPSTNYAIEADVNASLGSAASTPNRVRVTATFQSQ